MMKKKILWICFLLVVFSVFVYGDKIEKNIEINEVNYITLECNAVMNVKIGDSEKLIVKSDKSNIQTLSVENKNGNLHITDNKQGKEWWNLMGVFSTDSDIKLDLTVKNLYGIIVSSDGIIKIDDTLQNDKFNISNLGSGKLFIETLNTGLLKANAMGSGSIEIKKLNVGNQSDISSSGTSLLNLYDIQCPNVELTVSGSSTMNIRKIKSDKISSVILGSGTISIQGEVNNLNLNVNGSGRYYSGLLKANNVKVKALGSSNVEVNALNEISVDIFGSAVVNVDGNPKVKAKNIYGSGSMIMETGTSMDS